MDDAPVVAKSTGPLVSVIVPNFNHEAFLRQRLNSIFLQSYQNIEVIVLDDCSSDNSAAVIEEMIAQYDLSLIHI